MAEASGDTHVRCGLFECSIPFLVQRAKLDNTSVAVM